jgi:hypothetical protein
MAAKKKVGIRDLRAIVRWADNQNENHWDSAELGEISVDGLIAAWQAADGCSVDLVLAEGTLEEKRRMRRALKMRVKSTEAP